MPSRLLGDLPSISPCVHLSLATSPTLYPLEIKGHFFWVSQSLRRKPSGGRKLVVLTHRPRESSPGNLLTPFPWHMAVWHPFLSEAHSQGWVPVVGAGCSWTCPVEPFSAPQPHLSPVCRLMADAVTLSLSAFPEWKWAWDSVFPAGRTWGISSLEPGSLLHPSWVT